jgi:hypothetical protein
MDEHAVAAAQVLRRVAVRLARFAGGNQRALDARQPIAHLLLRGFQRALVELLLHLFAEVLNESV